MKRFKWPLQRLLDVTGQRELVLRSELFALLQKITRLRQEIIRRRAVVRSLLADLADRNLGERLGHQALFMERSIADAREIRRLKAEMKGLDDRRNEKTAELVKARKYKETLARLREEARLEHVRGEQKLEQSRFDEVAQTAVARRLVSERVSSMD